MSNVDEIISSSKSNFTKSYDKDEWIKKKQEERTKAYNLIDKTALEVVSDINKFKTYLDVQGRFNKYSVGNALLITSQMANATQLKEFDDWKELGAFVKKNAIGITILEPGETYTRPDGSKGMTYNAKKMFDVSQTNYQIQNKKINYDDKVKLIALLKDSPVEIRAIDNIEEVDNKIAYWNNKENVIYVKRGEESQDVFKEVAREMARFCFDAKENEQFENFKSDCVAYMLCKKHKIDVQDFNIESIPNEFATMDFGQVRKNLSSIRNVTEDINTRMNQYYESVMRNTKTKEHER